MKERDTQATPAAARPKDAKPAGEDKVQGEGDYAADRRYRDRTGHFLESADVEKVARAAAPHTEAEAREMQEAEKEGRSHAHVPPKKTAAPKAPGARKSR